jgi:vitamin B12 transporter
MKRNLVFVAAAIISSQLTAQTDTTVKSHDEVVITANKYPNKASLTGKVLTIISKEQLERSGGKDLSQVLNEQASVYIGGANSNPGKDKSVYLRGASIAHTLITIDGVPLYDASGIGSNFDIRNISITSIERIEILKGSQSTLYGSDAIAGVINIITKKADNKPINGNVLLGYGSYNSFRGNAGINGKNGKVDYNLNYSLYKTDGINETASYTANPDKDGYTQHAVMAGFGFQLSDKVRVQPYLRYTKINGDLDQGAFIDELDYTYDQKSFQAGIRNEFNIGKNKLTLLYNYSKIDREYIDDSVKSRNGFDTYSKGLYKANEHLVDAFAHFNLNSSMKLTAGVDFRSSESDQEYFSVGFFGPYKAKYGSDSLIQNQLGLYAALNINLKSGFNVELGNRLNIHSEYGTYDVLNINPSYLFNSKVKLFANFSSGYRTPSLYQLFSEYGNKNLKPESSLTYEGGVQYFSPNKKFTSRAVYFKRDVENVLFFYTNPSTYRSQYINQDEQDDNGIELEATFEIKKGTTIKAFYTYLDGEIETKLGSGKDTTFFNLLRRPKSSFGFNISSYITDKLLISSNLNVFGERKDQYFDTNTFQVVSARLKSYALWDIYAEYRVVKNKLKLFADFRNILDSKYTEISGFNTLGFNINGGIRFTF